MRDDRIHIAMTVDSCDLLGPGNRAVLWVAGCNRNCNGCISSFRSDASARKHWLPQEVADWFLSIPGNPDGLTITGGEPFLQAAQLVNAIRLIRQVRPITVITYTGYTHAELADSPDAPPCAVDLLGQTDLLIDGPYLRDLDNGGGYAVGSSNQRLLLLEKSTLSRESVEEYYYDSGRPRRVQITLQDDQAVMIGVPGARAAQVWNAIAANVRKEEATWRRSRIPSQPHTS